MSDIRRALALSGGAAVSVGFARFGYALVLPAMRSDLALSYTAAGSLNTANAVGYLAGAMLVTGVVGRVGDRRLFVGGLWLTTVSLLLCAFTRDFGVLLVWRFLAGVGAAGTFICGGTLAGRLGVRAVAVYFSGGGLGMVASGAALPWLFEARGAGEWPYAWLAMALVCVPLSLAAMWGAATAPGPSASGRAESTWPWRRSLPLLGAYVMFGIGYISYMTFMVAWLMQADGAGLGLAAATSLLWCVLGAATLFAPRAWRAVSEDGRDGRLMAAALACLALGAALPLVMANVAGLVASAVLVGGSVFMVPASVTLYMKANLPVEQRSAALAAATVVFAAGQIVGPVFAGLLSDRYASLTVGLAVSAGVLAGAFLLALRQRALGR